MHAYKKQISSTDDNKVNLMDFPNGLGKPHLHRNWARSVDAVAATQGLTDVARGQLPRSRLHAKGDLDFGWEIRRGGAL